MKLAKLSLAAIVAAGAMTVANAQPLEEAIKGVEFSGMVRYRLNDKVTDAATESTSRSNDWDYLAKFTAPVTEDMKAVMAFASSSSNNSTIDDNGISTLGVDLRKVFFVYKKDALTVKAGMQALGLPVADNGFNGSKGNGAIAMYDAGAVTLAATYFQGAKFSNLTVGGDSLTTDTPLVVDAYIAEASESELAAAAVIGSFGPVNAQLWAMEVQSFVDLMIFAQVDGKFGPATITAQYINTELDDKQGGEDDSFFGIKVGANIDMFSVNAGYTTNGDDQGIYSLDGADSSVIHGGWRLGYEYENVADVDVMFIDAGASFGKYGVALGYAQADFDSTIVGNTETIAADETISEVWGQVSYKVAKNFNTYAKYSTMDWDKADHDEQYFRFEAKYSF